MEDTVLQVENLCVEIKVDKKYLPVVEDISFSLRKNTTLGIVGESGCGKSMTANTIMGILPKGFGRITQGTITLCGKDLTAMTEKEKQSVRGKDAAMIFQEPMTSLNPVYTVEKQMTEMLRAHDRKITKAECRERCLEMLKKVGIPAPEQRLKEYPHQLSGGMRQRVMIAMALLNRPSLLIADEPTTALDVTIQAQILDLFKELREEIEASIMLITHDMGVVANVADYVVIMYAGRICEYNSAEEIFDHPRHPYTQGLLRAIPKKNEDVEILYTIPGSVPTLQEMPVGCRFAERCQYATDRCYASNPPKTEMGEGYVCCWKYVSEKKEQDVSAYDGQVVSPDAETASSGTAQGE